MMEMEMDRIKWNMLDIGLFWWLWYALFFQGVTSKLRAVEVEALHCFYDATNGRNWDSNWQVDRPAIDPCWYDGVYCWSYYNETINQTEYTVDEIDFGSNNLVGTIPACLSNLTNLRSLVIIENNLIGSIPEEFWTLSNLKQLKLNNNFITGTISSKIGQCSKLQYLDLSVNDIQGTIPTEIGNLNLTHLDLRDNRMNGTIPVEIGNFIYLTFLDLSYNMLSGSIPVEIGNLTELKELILEDNRLIGSIPMEIVNLQYNAYLMLTNNTLSGTLSEEFFQHPWYYLGLDFNLFSGTLSITNKTTETICYFLLNNNQLEGTIPQEIGRISNLGILDLSFNRFNGTIPETIGNIKYIDSLLLNGNKLNGTIPSKIFRCSMFQNLNLGSNNLSGTIPMEIGNLSHLVILDLSVNSLIGTVLIEIWNSQHLAVVLLGSNSLHGSLHDLMSGYSNFSDNLFELDFSRNNFTGTVPIVSWVKHFPKLMLLYINNNELTGTIDNALGNWKKLEIVDMSHNKLSGTIPMLDNLKRLKIFVVDTNQFSGNIPSLKNCNKLLILSMRQNNLSGRLPILPNNMDKTILFILNSNQLSDDNLHDWLDELFLKASSLKFLSLFENRGLKGSIPFSIYNTKMKVFLAQDCTINGELPWNNQNSQSSISVAMLSQNRLSGPIPHRLINTSDNITNNQINLEEVYIDKYGLITSTFHLGFDISLKVKNGLYLSGNRFSESRNWDDWSNSQLPSYLSHDEKQAENLYITNETQFNEIITIALALFLFSLLIVYRIVQLPYIKTWIGKKKYLFTKKKEYDYVGFEQIKMMFQWLNNWFEGTIICILLIIYYMNGIYYSKGHPLSHFSLAYFESSSFEINIILLMIVLIWNGVVVIFSLLLFIKPPSYQIMANIEMDPGGSNTFNYKKGARLIILWIGWIFSIGIIIISFGFDSFPHNNTLNLSSQFLYFLQTITSLVMIAHNSLLAPRLAQYLVRLSFYFSKIDDRKRYQTYRNIVAFCLRTLVCIILPIGATFYFDDKCSRNWIDYWKTCVDNDPQGIVVNYYWTYNRLSEDGVNQISIVTQSNVTVMNWNNVCQKYNNPIDTCIRGILEKWGNVIVSKMIISILTPWINVIIPCLNNLSNQDSGEWRIGIVSLFTHVELVILLGLFCPLIVPFCAIVLLSNYWKFRYLLQKYPKSTIVQEDPSFPVFILVIPFFLQQIFWMMISPFSDESFILNDILRYGLIAIDCFFMIGIIIISYMEHHRRLFINNTTQLTKDIEIHTISQSRSKRTISKILESIRHERSPHD